MLVKRLFCYLTCVIVLALFVVLSASLLNEVVNEVGVFSVFSVFQNTRRNCFRLWILLSIFARGPSIGQYLDQACGATYLGQILTHEDGQFLTFWGGIFCKVSFSLQKEESFEETEKEKKTWTSY